MRRALVVALLLLPAIAGAQAPEDDAKALAKAHAEARSLVLKLGEEKDAARRDAIAARLAAIDSRAALQAAADGLKSPRSQVRRWGIGRLKDAKVAQVVPNLVVLATGEPDPDVRAQAHAAAVAMDRKLARTWYEHVVINDVATRRLAAIEALGEIAAPESVPLLATVVETVTVDVRTQLGTLASLDPIPVNLGTISAAAINVNIEVPRMRLVEAYTSVQVPVEVRMKQRDEAFGALRKIAGQDLGKDTAAYRAWYKERQASAVFRGDDRGRK